MHPSYECTQDDALCITIDYKANLQQIAMQECPLLFTAPLASQRPIEWDK